MNYYYITGTSRGIGKAIAEALLNESESVVYGIARHNTIDHPNYKHYHLDLTDSKAVMNFAFSHHPDAESIVLINNAGTLGEVKHLGNLSDQAIVDGFNVNLIAPAILMNNFIAKYQDANSANLIINLTSGAAQNPYDGWAIYSPGKAGIDMLSKVAALEQERGRHKNPIVIKAIAPGVVETRMQEVMRSLEEQDFSRKQKFVDLREDKALYTPEAVAREFVKIIKNPQKLNGVVHRILL